ncbi:PQQ-binding-like beta-propeller repeat protein [Sphingomonas sp. BK235]|uniref:outer membrane protein assembly factor BamB family protein n=1 Tax=Sphingomonas sp. BK235 TaxID=2512131 RepID=UPI0010EEA9EB|nr:PQQ-binding-like beta-propeller repeat protein [Sphingomonas sp. BK235]TCP30659.1 quinoprotein glucose dehydrogenase [Sphingomonas sp. BK235]
MRAAAALLVATGIGGAARPAPPAADWTSFGGDEAGQRFSPLAEITPANVARLTPIWTFELRPADRPAARLLVSNITPLAIGGTLYLATPYGRVVALDGATGATRWSAALPEDDGVAGRALAYWRGDASTPARLFVGTRSGRLLAFDAATGRAAAGFAPLALRTPAIMNGTDGGGYPAGYSYQINSAPAVIGDVIVTGARLQESPARGPAGDVRGWDARTGRLLWTFHSIPRAGERFAETWRPGDGARRSGVNVWSSMAADVARGIVYVPFGTPAYDRVGVDRPGANLFANALVALDARSGRYLWHFQTVHHDIWDLDLPVQPTLLDVRRGGRVIPAVAAMNKSGYLFVLDRVSGKPLFPVRERRMPASSVAGEQAWPTQPIPAAPAPLTRQAMTADDIAALTPAHSAFCRARVARERAGFAAPFEPLRTDRPMVRFPGSGGGPNWGGGGYDAGRGLYVINTSELGSIEQLGQDAQGNWYNVAPGPSWFGQDGTRLPCQRPPWGQLAAVEVASGRIAWQVPLGVTDELPVDRRATGRPNVGGPLVTATGLTFIGATDDRYVRAFATATGRELWRFRLGAAAHAQPVSYQGGDGRQYVALVSAGGSYLGSPNSASRLVVFALPRAGERGVAAAAAQAVAPVRAPRAAATTPVAAPAPASPDLAPGPGKALAERACTACHVAAQVTAQRRSRADWAATVEKMVGYGAQVPDAEFDALVDYLARHYPAAG